MICRIATGWLTRTVLVGTALLATLPVCAEVYELPPVGQDVVGSLITIKARSDDTLLDIARRHGLGYEDIVRANPDVDTWIPGAGTEVVLPTRYVLPPAPRSGVILNLAEYRLYYYPPVKEGQPAQVMTYPISIGRMDWATPLGRTKVTQKVRNPSWYPPASIRAEHAEMGDPLPRIVPPGPDNPLGDRAMRLGIPGYLIHGTNRPAGVGMRVTHGCIRMFPEDIEFLFDRIPVNTTVRIINEPVKVGWDGERLVVEVHETLESAPAENAEAALVEEGAAIEELVLPPARDAMTDLTTQFVAATRERPGELDWTAAQQLLDAPTGIPVAVGAAIKNAATSAASE
ncbi:MAG: L,D-transpeptidase family protein [Pseudomonadota bacterium]